MRPDAGAAPGAGATPGEVRRRLIGEARPYLWRLGVALLLAACAGLGLVAFAPAFKLLITYVIDDPRHDQRILWEIIAGVFAVNLFANVAGYASSYLTAWCGQRLVADLRVRLLGRALRLPASGFDAWRPGELLSRSTTDLQLMGDAVSVALPQLVQVVATFVASLVYMIVADWYLTTLLLVIAPIIAFAVGRFHRLIALRSTEAQGQVADVVANLSEALHAQRVVKAFRREGYETERFRAVSESYREASMRLTQLLQLQIPVVGMLVVCALLAVVWLSAREVTVGRMDAGGVFQFWTLVSLSINPMNRIAVYLGDLSRGVVGASRVYEVLDLPEERATPPDPLPLPSPVRGAVAFERVSFAYAADAEPVLRDFSLEIPAGSVVALVGPSGAGKTTIAQLIPRLYELRGGRVLLDGVDVARVPLDELRRSIGVVPQEPQLFRATIAENIRYGRLDATDEDVERAAREANADEFVRALPRGYGTLVGETGVRLSGGQRQRVAIARAIVRDPRIIVLDEATSALDSHSERLIEEAFDRVFAGRTTIVIAHRLSTIRRADRIVYVERGAVRELGTHDELLARDGAYARLYSAQRR